MGQWLNLEERIDILSQLGTYLNTKSDYLEAIIHRTEFNNQWFTKANLHLALDGITSQFLQKDLLTNWITSYQIQDNDPKKIGLVMAGNIPLVGFHDVLSTFVSGNISQIKLSEKDKFLLPYFIKRLTDFNSNAAHYFEVVERIHDFDGVIATGSDNSARYFDAYFGKYPNIIRRNRNSIAILTGKESKDEILALGKDIFSFFGLGCRNVSKLYVPTGYQFDTFLEVLHEGYKSLVLNTKYKNNYDYNYSLWLLNQVKFLMNGSLILLESESLQSRISSLHFEYYDNIDSLKQTLDNQRDKIQCVVGNDISEIETFPLGDAQSPTLTDYPDGVDIMKFLINIA